MTIKNNTLHIKELENYFEHKPEFYRNDIQEFYKNLDADVPKSTVDWRIYELVQKGVLQRIGRGLYRLGSERIFKLELNREITKLAKEVNEQFPYINTCFWQSKAINLFSQHLSNDNMLMVEVEKEASEAVFHYLQERGRNLVFLNPNEELMTQYVTQFSKPIIVKDLISEAPIQKIDGLNTPTIEKLLVDLYSDKILFQAFQGNELKRIFQNTYERFTINENKLLRYASRRGNREKIENFQKQIFGKNDK